MSFRLHKFVLALCVTLCLAVALWPREPAAAQAPPVLGLGAPDSPPVTMGAVAEGIVPSSEGP